jgi:hypothetical protein
MVTATATTDASNSRLARIDAALAEMRARPGTLTALQRSVRLAALLRERANLTGRDADAHRAEKVASAALTAGGRHPDLVITLAQLHVDGHELGKAAALLDQWPEVAASASGRAIHAGLLRQRGELVAAGLAFAELVAAYQSWKHVAGLASVFADLDDLAPADALFALAEQDIDAHQMGAFAWVEVQRAQLWLRAGDTARGERHLSRAEASLGGWRAVEQRARWLAHAADLKHAATLYTELCERTRRPDHRHALGDILTRLGQPKAAAAHHRAAHQAYAAAQERGEPRYTHHHAEFCLYVTGDLDTALHLARKDHSERPNPHAGRLLVTVLRARGATIESARLANKLAADRAQALRELNDRNVLGQIVAQMSATKQRRA